MRISASWKKRVLYCTYEILSYRYWTVHVSCSYNDSNLKYEWKAIKVRHTGYYWYYWSMREYASRWNGCAEKAMPIKKKSQIRKLTKTIVKREYIEWMGGSTLYICRYYHYLFARTYVYTILLISKKSPQMWMIQANKDFFCQKINISTRFASVSLRYNIVTLSRTAFVGTP